jgi:hypothetical protein
VARDPRDVGAGAYGVGMSEIEIRPASADRFADAEHALTGGGDGRPAGASGGCCEQGLQRRNPREKRELLRADLMHEPASAFALAYVDGEAADGSRSPLAPTSRARAHARVPGRPSRSRTARCGRSRASSCGASTAARARSRLSLPVDHARRHGAVSSRAIRWMPRPRRRRRTSFPRRAVHVPRRRFLGGRATEARAADRDPHRRLTPGRLRWTGARDVP